MFLFNRLSDAQSSINSTRSTQSEIVKTMENMRRETVSQTEQTHVRLRQEMSDMNNQLMQRTVDKLDRLRDDIEYKSKETEKVKEEHLGSVWRFKTEIWLNILKIKKQNHQLEHEQRQRQLQTMHNEFEQQIETLKGVTNEEHGRIYNEIRVFSCVFLIIDLIIHFY